MLEKTIPGWNQVYSPSNVFEVAEVEDGVLPGVYLAGSDLKPFLNTDLMVSATQTKASPQTLVYKIKPNAVWDDGIADQLRRLQVPEGRQRRHDLPEVRRRRRPPATTRSQSMTGSDNGKTVTVVMKTPFADWQSMFGALLPAHIAAQHGGTSGASSLQHLVPVVRQERARPSPAART